MLDKRKAPSFSQSEEKGDSLHQPPMQEVEENYWPRLIRNQTCFLLYFLFKMMGFLPGSKSSQGQYHLSTCDLLAPITVLTFSVTYIGVIYYESFYSSFAFVMQYLFSLFEVIYVILVVFLTMFWRKSVFEYISSLEYAFQPQEISNFVATCLMIGLRLAITFYTEIRYNPNMQTDIAFVLGTRLYASLHDLYIILLITRLLNTYTTVTSEVRAMYQKQKCTLKLFEVQSSQSSIYKHHVSIFFIIE